jgi:hypothetical protein
MLVTGGSKLLWNIDKHLPDYTVQYLRYISSWESEISPAIMFIILSEFHSADMLILMMKLKCSVIGLLSHSSYQVQQQLGT